MYFSFRFPPITQPNFSHFWVILQDAFVISIVTFSVAISLAQVFAKQFAYSISPSQVNTVLCLKVKLMCYYTGVYCIWSYEFNWLHVW